MHERPELTFIRGESLIYETVEKRDPVTFAKLKALVRAGRWDVVGGNFLQPDMNLPAARTLAKNFIEGQAYFRRAFGKTVRAGWSADCFGHSAGLPDLLNAAGLRYYAFGRPAAPGGPCGLPESPIFWWHGPAGGRVLAHRTTGHWYGCERDEISLRLDQTLTRMLAPGAPRHTAVFYGLGNHGGGPTRRHLDDIAAWATAHPEVRVVHSGLHRFFRDTEREITAGRLRVPDFTGELNPTLRGVYSAAAKIKFAFRRAEAATERAARAVTGSTHACARRPAPLPESLWRGVVFNAFHDILPGTCIESAMEQQLDELRGLCHQAHEIEGNALVDWGGALRPTVPPAPAADLPGAVPFLVWNPLDRPWRGLVELEAGLDYRPLFTVAHPDLRVLDGRGKPSPFQSIPQAHNFMPHLTWRRRVLCRLSLPAKSATIVSLGWVPGHKPPAPLLKQPAHSSNAHTIANGYFRLSAQLGSSGLNVSTMSKGHSKTWLRGLTLRTVEDPWGPWGAHYDEPGGVALNTARGDWRIVSSVVEESGPLRASLRVRMNNGLSTAEFVFRLEAERRAVDVEARIFWADENARLKLVFPVGARKAAFEVPGAVVERGACGEMPGGRWLRTSESRRPLGLATNALYDYDLHEGAVQATILRSSRYTQSEAPGKVPAPRGPVIDRGEYCFRLAFTDDTGRILEFADELEFPVGVQPVTAHS